MLTVSFYHRGHRAHNDVMHCEHDDVIYRADYGIVHQKHAAETMMLSSCHQTHASETMMMPR